MKNIRMIDLMTDENQAMILKLHNLAKSEKIQIVKKNNDLILKGFLKIVQPKNKAQAYFVNNDECIVELSPKGQDLIFKALV